MTISPWTEIVAGCLGVALALAELARLRHSQPRGPHDRLSSWALLVSSLVIIGIGVLQSLGLGV